jgi:hypothetical protein
VGILNSEVGKERRWEGERKWEGGMRKSEVKRSGKWGCGNKRLKKRITNIEQGIMNVEGRYSIIIILGNRLSAAIPHFIIRYFLFDIRYSIVNSGLAG